MSDDIENYMDEYESELYRKLPPGNALIFFFIALTLIYGFIIIYNIMTLSSEGDVEDAISNIYKNTNSNIYTIIYIIFLITGISLSVYFAYLAQTLTKTKSEDDAWNLFKFSNMYLFTFFILLVLDTAYTI